MGETAAKFSAQLVDQDERAYSNCSIDLLLVDNTGIHRMNNTKREINFHGTKFEQLFIIGPEPQIYIAEITCLDAVEIYQSRPVELGAGVVQHVNLGRIILTRNK